MTFSLAHTIQNPIISENEFERTQR